MINLVQNRHDGEQGMHWDKPNKELISINQLPSVEGGCLGYPAASTVASQPLDRIQPHSWQIPTTQTWAPIPGTCHTEETVKGRKIRDGRRGEDSKATAPQTAAQTLNEELKDPGSVQNNHAPCDHALMGLSAGCPLSIRIAWPLSLWAAWLLSSWTAWQLSSFTTWPLKLVVVNLVKLHFTN